SGGCRSVERTGQACRASVESQPRRRPDDVDNPQPDGDDAAAAAAGAADVPLAFTWKGATMKLKHRLEDIGDQLEELALAARAEEYQGVSMTFGAAQFSLSVPELLATFLDRG